MTSRKRRLIFSKVDFVSPLAARCSACQRPFEVRLEDGTPLGTAYQRITAMFDGHSCELGSHSNKAG
jgi:hypothetical protein